MVEDAGGVKGAMARTAAGAKPDAVWQSGRAAGGTAACDCGKGASPAKCGFCVLGRHREAH